MAKLKRKSPQARICYDDKPFQENQPKQIPEPTPEPAPRAINRKPLPRHAKSRQSVHVRMPSPSTCQQKEQRPRCAEEDQQAKQVAGQDPSAKKDSTTIKETTNSASEPGAVRPSRPPPRSILRSATNPRPPDAQVHHVHWALEDENIVTTPTDIAPPAKKSAVWSRPTFGWAVLDAPMKKLRVGKKTGGKVEELKDGICSVPPAVSEKKSG
jgi:hypothetical protein